MHETPEPLPAPAAGRGPLLVVFLTVFIDLLGFGIVLPVLPRQVAPYLGAIGLSVDEGAGGAVVGLLFSVFSLMQFLFSPLWGRLSDRIGRRPILLVSLTGSVVFYAVYAAAVSVPVEPAPTRSAALWALGLILLARIGAGIAGASVGTAAAVIADCTTPENRARGMALIGIAFGGGFTLGPLIAFFGQTLFDQARWGVGALASVLSLVALLIALAVFRETRRPGTRTGRERVDLARGLAVLRMPAVGTLVLVYFLAIVAMAGFESTLALFTQQAFGMTDDENFLVFAAIGFVLLVTGGCYRPLAKRFAERRLLAVGVAIMIAGLASLAAVALVVTGRGEVAAPGDPRRLAFYAAAALAVVGFAFINPSVSALISRWSDPERQGEVLGVNQSFASLARIIGPLAGMSLFSLHASRTVPYALSMALLLVVAVLLPRITAAPAANRPG